jgi:Mg2+/Co2+ transporter CorC/osmotically-inducible protein OsmY
VTLLYRTLGLLFPPRDSREVAALVHAAIRAGALPRQVSECLKAALQLPQLRLRDVMVPRVDVVAIPESYSAIDAARQMIESGRKRLPVYHDTIDHPIGVLHALDVAWALANTPPGTEPPPAGQLARPAQSFPETVSLLDAIEAMRSQALHFVLITDERGGFAGLATLEDLLEQMFGPIPDEYGDQGRDAIRVVDNGVAIVSAAAGLHEIERVLDVRFPRGRFSSISGLVYDRLKRVPRRGEVVDLPGVRIEVLSVDGARLRELRIRTAPAIGPGTELLDVGIGKEVVCGTETVGRVDHLIGEPTSGRVRELVVRLKDRSVALPLDMVERTDEGVVYLKAEACSFDRFPAYAQPEVSLGTTVVSLDGTVGPVRQVVIDKTSAAATHVVVRMSNGLLVPRDIVVPLSWARSVTPDRIELAASRDELLELPEFRPDDEIAADIARRLGEDPRFGGIDRYTLAVDVRGGVVRLTGRVRTSELKEAAHELVARVPGVVAVDNQAIADDEISVGLEHALRGAGVHIEELDVATLLGQVKLRGRAASPEDSRAAERLARSFPGVQLVVNDLAVEQAQRAG